nr:MAG TPA: hypothetical protein [Caudoviricetes sp.]
MHRLSTPFFDFFSVFFASPQKMIVNDSFTCAIMVASRDRDSNISGLFFF